METITMNKQKVYIGVALIIGLLVGGAIGVGAGEHGDGEGRREHGRDNNGGGYERTANENNKMNDPADTKNSNDPVDPADPKDTDAVNAQANTAVIPVSTGVTTTATLPVKK